MQLLMEGIPAASGHTISRLAVARHLPGKKCCKHRIQNELRANVDHQICSNVHHWFTIVKFFLKPFAVVVQQLEASAADNAPFSLLTLRFQ